MLRIEIRETACRGCQLCIEECPTEVLAYDESKKKVCVDKAANCIACLSCAYVCPSGAFTHDDYHVVKNFYRDSEDGERLRRFL